MIMVMKYVDCGHEFMTMVIIFSTLVVIKKVLNFFDEQWESSGRKALVAR